MSLSMSRPRIALVTTSVLQVKFFLVPHLQALAEDYDVTLILNNDMPEVMATLNLPVKVEFINIARQVKPWQDLKALWVLIRRFRQGGFDMVHSVNPKAGLLAMLAAWLVRVPVRTHIFQGEVWANKTGVWRMILRNMDRLVSFCSTHLTVVSHSEREVLVSERIISARKSRVLASGSIGGVDLNRFRKDADLRMTLRQQFGYTDSDVVFMFLGRLTREKGLEELSIAFEQVSAGCPNMKLHVVGPDEDNIANLLAPLMAKYPGQITLLPFSKAPERDLQVADVLMLPSHREGFGVVIIEAAALGVPAIGSAIYGISDALVDGKTGLTFPVRNPVELGRCMALLYRDEALREQLGAAAYKRVVAEFDQRRVIQAFVDYHAQLLGQRAV